MRICRLVSMENPVGDTCYLMALIGYLGGEVMTALAAAAGKRIEGGNAQSLGSRQYIYIAR